MKQAKDEEGMQCPADPPCSTCSLSALEVLRMLIEANDAYLDRLQQDHRRMTGERHRWFK